VFIVVGRSASTANAATLGYQYNTVSGNTGAFLGVYGDGVGTGLFIQKGGNVGIGTGNPLYGLDVFGTFRPRSGITGTTTNDNAAAGDVGEFVSTNVANGTIFLAASGAYGNVASISLTPGDWDVTGVAVLNANGASYSTGSWGVAVSSYSGNTTTDHVLGVNQLYFNDYSGNDQAGPVPVVRFSLASTTTLYLKATANYSSGSPYVYGRLSARRVR